MKVYDIECHEHEFVHSIDARDAIESGFFFGSVEDAKKAADEKNKVGEKAREQEKKKELEAKRVRRESSKAAKKKKDVDNG